MIHLKPSNINITLETAEWLPRMANRLGHLKIENNASTQCYRTLFSPRVLIVSLD